MRNFFLSISILLLIFINCDKNRELIKNIKWFGGSSTMYKGSKIIFFDPASTIKNIKNEEKADIILITHSHLDHISKSGLDKVVKASSIIITNKSTSYAVKSQNQIKIVKAGDKINIDGIEIEAVASYEINEVSDHPKSSGYTGFIVTIDGIRIYQSGDAGLIPEMNSFKDIDIAFLYIGASKSRNDDMIKAADIIKPRVWIPIEYAGRKQPEDYIKKNYKGLFITLKSE